ncbi:UNVERIFIED_CONTAM: hypothetical protein GTU68_024829 [Idotea baltica]|nr:hypothetical protein [Idotea baltica]
MVSKEYHCIGDLLLRATFNDLNADIIAVISNHENLKGLVEQNDIPFHFVNHKGLDRAEHELAVHSCIDQYQSDYIVLAKYMRILTPSFVEKYNNRIVNIHHSFLPAFIGAKPYHQAFERGVKIIGATAHFVNNDLDEGPIIYQDVTHIDHRYSPRALASSGKDVEKIVLAKALKLVLNDRVFIHGNKTIVF